MKKPQDNKVPTNNPIPIEIAAIAISLCIHLQPPQNMFNPPSLKLNVYIVNDKVNFL